MSAKPFNPTGLLIFVLIGSIAGIFIWQFAMNRAAGPALAPFDRAAASELEIKGDVPDGTTSWSTIEVPKSPPSTAELAARGRELFAKACAGCHGAQGKGDGPLAKRFDVPTIPANLSAPLQWIKLHSTLDEAGGGVPTDSDLFCTLTRGLPGTQMFSYRALPEADRWALVHFVKTLSPDYEKNATDPVPIPTKPDGDLLKIGAQFYRTLCVTCHGEAGLGGSVPIEMNGKRVAGVGFAREGGIYMLGGSSEADIARTLMVGLSSLSAMRSIRSTLYPSERMSPELKLDADRKLWGTVLFVRELIEAQRPKSAPK